MTRLLIATAAALALAGCANFEERHFEIRAGDLVRIEPAADPDARPAARDWLESAHARLGRLLPSDDAPALTTRQLVDPAGRPIDVLKRFHRTEAQLESVFLNYHGLTQTVQSLGQNAVAGQPAPQWPGFEDVWIRVDHNVELSARLGVVRDDAGEPVRGTAIVFLPGFWGDNWVYRSHDLAQALRADGYHVLSLEQRGMGQTELAYPDVPYTWGVREAKDLFDVEQWLMDKPWVDRVGLIGYCWGANQVLVAGWYDAVGRTHPAIRERFWGFAGPAPEVGRPHYQAGIMAFSPTLYTERLIDACDTPKAWVSTPSIAGLQSAVRDLMVQKGYPNPDGSLRRLICLEAARAEGTYPQAAMDGVRFLRLLPHRGLPAYDKMEHVKVPTLVVNASNDLLAHPQGVADLTARTENPNFAALMLDGGGHLGFPAYHQQYYYSLMLNFFDPARGPRPVPNPHTPEE